MGLCRSVARESSPDSTRLDSTHALSVLTREKDGDGSSDALPVQEDRGPFELLVREDEIERRLRVEFDPLFGRRALAVSVAVRGREGVRREG